ncbi:hypothetical protein BLOT_001163 [Blomia tropicalis]|nr:hypothetical protein BLOT_001163 [Blomia tropicalis]
MSEYGRTNTFGIIKANSQTQERQYQQQQQQQHETEKNFWFNTRPYLILILYENGTNIQAHKLSKYTKSTLYAAPLLNKLGLLA